MAFSHKNRISFLCLALLACQPAVQSVAIPPIYLFRALSVLKETGAMAATDFCQRFQQATTQQLAAEMAGMPTEPLNPATIGLQTLAGMPRKFIASQALGGANMAAARLWTDLRHPNPSSWQNPTLKSAHLALHQRIFRNVGPWDANKQVLAKTGIGTGYSVLSMLASKQSLRRIACAIIPSLCIGLSSNLVYSATARLLADRGAKEPKFITDFNKNHPSLTGALSMFSIPTTLGAVGGLIVGKVITELWKYGAISSMRKKQLANQQARARLMPYHPALLHRAQQAYRR